jgi:protein-disulfide isomerase
MSKQFWAVIAVIVLVFVGVAVFNSSKSDNGGGSGDTKAATSHVKGAGTSGVTLVEYGDFQCPYCQQYYPTVQQVLADYGDQLKFQFVNFPLTSLHQNAFAASRAAEAAGKQGKFWEMYDQLYQNNDPNGRTGWVASNAPTSFFNQFAQQIGLNQEQFKKDYASAAVNNAVNADLAKGNKLKVDSTPTFYLDGKKITVTNSVDEFKKVIDAAIKQKNPSGDAASGQMVPDSEASTSTDSATAAQ